MKNVISNNDTMMHLIRTNRAFAYSYAQCVTQQMVVWEEVARVADLIPDELKHLGVVDKTFYNTYRRKFYRMRTFMKERGMYVDGMLASDFDHVAAVKYKNTYRFIFSFPTRLDRMTWAHDVIARCASKNAAEMRPYYVWSMTDHVARDESGQHMEM